MTDATESFRRDMLLKRLPEVDLYMETGPTWDTQKLQEEFKVLSFMAPFVIVERKSDGKKGTLEFTHSPRVYFNFQEDN
jgi:hypothetical protein